MVSPARLQSRPRLPRANLELLGKSAMLVACRYTSFIARSVRKIVKSWFVPAIGKAPSARIAARRAFRKSFRFLLPPSPVPASQPRPAGMRRRRAPAAAGAVAAAEPTTTIEEGDYAWPTREAALTWVRLSTAQSGALASSCRRVYSPVATARTLAPMERPQRISSGVSPTTST